MCWSAATQSSQSRPAVPAPLLTFASLVCNALLKRMHACDCHPPHMAQEGRAPQHCAAAREPSGAAGELIAELQSSHHAQGVLAGQAVAGVAVSVLSFVTLWATPLSGTAATARSLALPAFLYFATATATTVLSAAAYVGMWRRPFVKAHWGSVGGQTSPSRSEPAGMRLRVRSQDSGGL